MNRPVQILAIATLMVVLFFGSATVAGAFIERDDAGGEELRLTIEDVIQVPDADAPDANVDEGSADGEMQTAVVATADEPFRIKSILPIDGPIRYGEWHWDESRAPADGQLVMTVDLEARVISVFRDGHEIGAAATLLGTEEHPTPLGTFPILTKERHNVSEKYGNAPMPWTLRLTWDGVAIHGGSQVENGYASHGCIGVPDELASRLFEIAKKGDKVIITRGKTAGVGDTLL